jgi:hypothetical protein
MINKRLIFTVEKKIGCFKNSENALKEAIRRLQGSNLDYASAQRAQRKGHVVLVLLFLTVRIIDLHTALQGALPCPEIKG